MSNPNEQNQAGSREPLSWASVVSRKTLGNLTIPPNSLDVFYKSVSDPFMLVIFNPQKSSLKMEVFPVSSKEVLKLQLTLTAFSQEIFQQISGILRNLNLEKIYTSGVCLKEGLCIYEAYIEENQLPTDRNSVVKMFGEIQNLKEDRKSVV